MATSEKRQRADVFKSGFVTDAYFSPVYEFPWLRRTWHKPNKAIPFDKATKSTRFDHWIHFYIHDKQFECVWNNPKQYLNLLSRFGGIITPDFSLYRELPLAMQIWNTYRNRAGDERTYSFAFEGIEQGGTVAVSTNGCIQKNLTVIILQRAWQKW